MRKPPAPPAAALKKVAPEMTCPAPLGVGVKTKLSFCEVMAGRDPAGGLIIQIPPHKGPATLTFDLHNLHTYSEEQVKAHRAFTRYTATIGVLTMDNTLISRGGRAERVPHGGRPRRSRRRRRGSRRREGGRADRHASRSPSRFRKGELSVSLLGEKLAVERIDGAADLHAARPSDRRRQQRDAGVSSGAAAEAGEGDGEEEIG